MAFASQYYICNKCRFRTTLFSRIEEHLLEHSGSKEPSPFSYFDCFDRLKPLKCPSCDFSTAKLKTCKKCGFCTHSNYMWIRNHIFGSCKSKKQLKEKKKRVRVLWKRDGKWYLCKKCDYRSVNTSHLKTHFIYKHTPLEQINWQECKECPGKFKTVHGLKKHQKYVHVSAVDHLNCPECDYSTPSRYNLGMHFNNKHARPEEIKWVECYKCGAKFKNKGKLKRHLLVHTTKPFKCDQCSFEAHRKSNLKRHIVSRHLKDEEIKWHKCQHCSFEAKSDSNLRSHITRFHNDSIFKCDLCNYRTKCEKTIEIHKKNKHENSCAVSDVKLLKCEHCDYSSKFKHNIERHVLAKHNVDGEVLNCKECDYKTHSKFYLTKHTKRVRLMKQTTQK